MLGLVGLQCAFQVGGRIALATARRNAVAEDLPANLLYPRCDIQRPALFNAPQDFIKQFGRVDLRNGPVADKRENIHFKAAGDVLSVGGCPAR